MQKSVCYEILKMHKYFRDFHELGHAIKRYKFSPK
jgi:hypothetical protein